MALAAVMGLALAACQRAEARGQGPLRAAPAGASILFFDLDECPQGWEPYEELNGRVVVGLTEMGALAAQVGTALAPGGSVTVSVPAAHTHTVDAPATGTSGDSHNHSYVSRNPHDGDGADTEITDGTNLIAGTVTTSTESHSHSVTFASFDTAVAGEAATDVTMPYLQLSACSRAGIPVAPPGSIAFFHAASCPADWTAVASARGRIIVAAQPGGNIGATVGDALADQAERTISDVAAHSHAVDPPSTSVEDDSHTHTFLSAKVHDGDGGNGNVVQEADSNNDALVNVDSDNHSHSVNPPAVESQSAGDAAVAVTMPYVQVLVCERNP